MTTNTTTTTPCHRCGTPDRTRAHHCPTVRSLAAFRAALLVSLLVVLDADGFHDYYCCPCPDCGAQRDAEQASELAAERASERYFEEGPDDGFDAYEARMGLMSFSAAWDAADPSRTEPCPRHGTPKQGGACWECDMERDEAARDHAEDVAVAEYKAARDARMLRRCAGCNHGLRPSDPDVCEKCDIHGIVAPGGGGR